MNWLNISIATLSSEEFVGSDPTERATWLCLLGYCCSQENSGIIDDCREWKDRKWQQLVRVTAKEVSGDCDLWKWEGNDLIVHFYPVDQQEETQRRRSHAKTNGKRGGRPRKNPEKTDVPPEAQTDQEPTSVSPEKAEGKDKDKGNTPQPPQGGGDEGDHQRILPKDWKRMSEKLQRQTRCLGNSPAMARIGAFLGRRATKIWTVAEAAALWRIRPDPDDLDILEAYYLAEIPKPDDHRRRSLPVLLNNWSGEVDRGRLWLAENPQIALAPTR